MKDKARLIVGGIIIVVSIAAAAIVAICKPESSNSVYWISLAGLAFGYYITTS